MKAKIPMLGIAFLSILLSVPARALAQESKSIPLPVAEVAAGYTFMRDFSQDLPEDLNFPAGWYASAAVNINRWFGLVAEGTGSYKTNFDVTFPDLSPEENRAVSELIDFDARVYTLMGGPRFFRKTGRVVTFAQALAGGARLHLKVLHTPPGEPVETLTERDTYFAFQPGGGVTVFLNEVIGVRLAADYRLIVDRQDAASNEYANEFRMVSGLTFNWGRR